MVSGARTGRHSAAREGVEGSDLRSDRNTRRLRPVSR